MPLIIPKDLIGEETLKKRENIYNGRTKERPVKT